jgi:hypothetical protein
MLIIGIRLFFWGSQFSQAMRCGKCGYAGPFTLKKGMRFITLFFIIPVIPVSGVMRLAECKQCKTRYQVNASSQLVLQPTQSGPQS